MKHTFTLLLLALLSNAVFAQGPPSRVPDPDTISPNPGWYYYENKGQIIDQAGTIRSDIKYYNSFHGTDIYLGADTISFLGETFGADSLSYDTTHRIDMQFYCPDREFNQSCPNMLGVYEQSSDFLNFYLPHCGTGVEDVYGYAGVVYQNAFSNIDVHFFSDGDGPVGYFVFHPGSDTSAFILHFNGQDSIVAIANYLHVYSGGAGVVFPNGIAYQIDPYGNIVPLGWTPTWYDASSGNVKLQYGAYNPAWDLVIRTGAGAKGTANGTDNLVWTTYYGGKGNEANPDARWPLDAQPIVKSTADGSAIFHAMPTSTDSFATQAGSTAFPVPQSQRIANFDCFLSSFDNTGKRLWATYYGGSNYEEPTALELLPSDIVYGNLLMAGRTQSTSFPTPAAPPTLAWQKTTNLPVGAYNGKGSFLASFSAGNGHYFYYTFFGGGAYCYLTDLCFDGVKNEIDFCGYVHRGTSSWPAIIDTTSNTPASTMLSLRRSSGRYYQNFDSSLESGFVGAFHFDSSRGLSWCSLLGGNSTDFFDQIIHDNTSGHEGLYLVGTTSSHPITGTTFGNTALTGPLPGFCLPFVSPGTGTPYFQYITGLGPTGMLFHFNVSRAIDWGAAAVLEERGV